MVNLSDLVLTQNNLYSRIKNAYANFIEKYRDQFEVLNIDSRLKLLNKNWEDFQQNHELIISNKSDTNKEHHYYKNPDQYITDVQEFYYDEEAKFLIAREAKSPAIVSQHEQSVSAPIIAHVNQLPKIPLPKFSGDAKDWITFKDLFNDMVVKSNHSDSSKLSYLMDSLKDEPFYLYQSNCYRSTF